jgi:hypothetical protein
MDRRLHGKGREWPFVTGSNQEPTNSCCWPGLSHSPDIAAV